MTLPLSAGSVEAAFTKPPFDENSVYGLMCAISRQKLNYSSHVPQGRNFRDARPAADGLKNKISGVELRSSQITYWKIVNAWFFKLASCYLGSAILSI